MSGVEDLKNWLWGKGDEVEKAKKSADTMVSGTPAEKIIEQGKAKERMDKRVGKVPSLDEMIEKKQKKSY